MLATRGWSSASSHASSSAIGEDDRGDVRALRRPEALEQRTLDLGSPRSARGRSRPRTDGRAVTAKRLERLALAGADAAGDRDPTWSLRRLRQPGSASATGASATGSSASASATGSRFRLGDGRLGDGLFGFGLGWQVPQLRALGFRLGGGLLGSGPRLRLYFDGRRQAPPRRPPRRARVGGASSPRADRPPSPRRA